ncbi:MAG: hypothetical protein KBA51_01570 [Kiritimatiellae bacterium]|nr:hypothetical protein [Kiritimatiellia bacterium]
MAIGCGGYTAPASPPPGRISAGWLRTFGVDVGGQFPSDMDRGGEVQWSAWKLEVGVLRLRPESWTLGGGVQYAVQDFSFDSPDAFGGTAPWERVDVLSLNLWASTRLQDAWTLRLAPSARMSHEFGADTRDAWAYGGIALAQGRVSPQLQLGLGVGVFRDLDRTRGFPLMTMDWKPTDTFRVSHPHPVGPVGPAGLQASWAVHPDWTLGLGASYYSDRFRLKHRPDQEAEIGQWRGIPVWVRGSWRNGPFQATCMVGYILSGELETETQAGHSVGKDDMDPAPFVAVALSVPLHLPPPRTRE